jgi:hypothetical protein
VDGYAVGVDPLLSGDPDVLTLWRVVNGVMSVPVVQADISDVIYDWGIAQDIVGFEIVRSSSGNWTLRVDADGGFDNLSTIGSGADATYTEMNFFGMRFIHTGSNGGKLALDDLEISQTGCRDIYYSRATGNFSDPIWSTQPTGLPNPSTIEPGRWTRLVVQAYSHRDDEHLRGVRRFQHSRNRKRKQQCASGVRRLAQCRYVQRQHSYRHPERR